MKPAPVKQTVLVSTYAPGPLFDWRWGIGTGLVETNVPWLVLRISF